MVQACNSKLGGITGGLVYSNIPIELFRLCPNGLL